MFEMHTQGANRGGVPPKLVSGKGKPQVDQILLDLIDAGYGILDVRPNPADKTCAEMSLLLLDVVEDP